MEGNASFKSGVQGRSHLEVAFERRLEGGETVGMGLPWGKGLLSRWDSKSSGRRGWAVPAGLGCAGH